MKGLGLRRDHFAQVLAEKPDVAWFEILTENYLHNGSPNLQAVLNIREHYQMSMHGVGLSLGSADGIDQQILNKIKNLIKQIDPILVSEHLSWSRIGQVYMPDLLPVPYNEESFNIFSKNISVAQDYLQREILIENPSSYLEYKDTDQSEVDFLVALCKKTGAKILLDINNIFVSSHNNNWDAKKYINSIPANLVKQIHIAGHSKKLLASGKELYIDTHDTFVAPQVWELYHFACKKFGTVPTILEWDDQIPALSVLIAELNKAENVIA